MIEEKHRSRTTGDGGIGKIENGSKECLSGYQRHPIGPTEEGKIEHVDNVSPQETAIALSELDEMCRLGKRGR